MWQSWMGWKMPLRKWHILWMVPCLICCFIVTLFHIERKWLLIWNSTIILPLKSKLSAKFQRFNAIDGSIKMLKISWIWKKNQLKWKVVKHFTRPSKETIQGPTNPPPLDKTLLCLWNKNFLTKIYRNTYTFAFKLHQECRSWVSRNGTVQMFFWQQTETCLLENLQSQKGDLLLENLKIWWCSLDRVAKYKNVACRK